MDFSLTEEQIMIRDTAREFAQSEVEPKAIELESRHEFPMELTNKMAEMGFHGLVIPEKFGGAGVDYLSYLLVEQEIARASISLSMTLGAQNSLVAIPLMECGSEELQKKYLPKIASGEWLGCFALTEPGAGSDPAGMATTAKRDGDHWVINGTKIYITNGSVSKLAIVWAKTGTKPDGKAAITTFLVDREQSPYRTGTIEHKMGVHASPTTELIFEDCRVPASHMMGKEGEGFKIALSTLNAGRLSVATQCIGIAKAAYERAKRFSKEREQFGKKISEFQAIAFKLADCAVGISAAELLVQKAAWLKEQRGARDPEFISLAAQAKLFASEMACRVTDEAVQIHGGYGYMKEYRVEEFFRAARLMELVEGTSEIQRLTISRWELRD
ncbi:MAG: acyl-CoA dehydrogenase family protein [Planctomycetes bacterium]|nr:acyl-CoA dehydrogenase family protein [Planctomycetota bacterium]NUQ33947.1 acyl-CoA dehydrogenase family protein [Planctomycetaceae bacterium]